MAALILGAYRTYVQSTKIRGSTRLSVELITLVTNNSTCQHQYPI